MQLRFWNLPFFIAQSRKNQNCALGDRKRKDAVHCSTGSPGRPLFDYSHTGDRLPGAVNDLSVYIHQPVLRKDACHSCKKG